jgi:succinate dehydrogenase/fumarate reductase flavoprotein subunit
MTNDIRDSKLSRRQFIGTTAAGAAAVGAGAILTPKLGETLASSSTKPTTLAEMVQAHPSVALPKLAQPIPVPSSWNGVADVIVVGLGGAGAAAALNAAAAGAQVLVLEKLATPGGSSGIAAGAFAAPGTPLQIAKGIPDTPGKMFDFWTKAGMGTTDPDVLLSYCENSLAAWTWLSGVCASVAGITAAPSTLWGAPGFSGSSYVTPSDVIPRFISFSGYGAAGIPSGGPGEFQCGYAAVQANANIKVMLSTPAVGLITNNGEVVGVQALVNDSPSFFQAKRGVVLTTGSFARNDEMSQSICPFVYYGYKLSSLGDTGDGIVMGQQVGAALSGAFGAMSHPRTTEIPAGSVQGTGGSWGTNGSHGAANGELATTSIIFVNNRGQRFVNESTMSIAAAQLQPWQISSWTSYYAGLQIFSQDQHQAWAIFDNQVASKGGTTIVSYFSKDLSTEIAGGYVVTAATIPALAAAMGVNPTALTNTVNMWNTDSANNTDTLYGRPNNFMQINTPPYFAAVLTWTCDDAWGGLKINGKTQVLDTLGNPIPRLYAAGATTGGIVGPFYQHSGGAVGSAWTMGYVAGKNVAAQIPWA